MSNSNLGSNLDNQSNHSFSELLNQSVDNLSTTVTSSLNQSRQEALDNIDQSSWFYRLKPSLAGIAALLLVAFLVYPSSYQNSTIDTDIYADIEYLEEIDELDFLNDLAVIDWAELENNS